MTAQRFGIDVAPMPVGPTDGVSVFEFTVLVPGCATDHQIAAAKRILEKAAKDFRLAAEAPLMNGWTEGKDI